MSEQKNTGTISTSQLIALVAERFDTLPKKITKDIISDFLETVETAVSEGKKLKLDKLGILEVKERAARMGRNPRTGEAMEIAASKKIAFRPAKSLKDQVVGVPKTNGAGASQAKKLPSAS